MKSKNIKIPLELVESLEKRNTGRSPGEKMLEIYKEYELLEGLASSISVSTKVSEKATVYERILRYLTDGDENVKDMQTQINELKTMLQGLQIFFTKVKGK